MATVPDPAYAEIIEYYSARLADPVERLRFLRLCSRVAQENPPLFARRPFAKWGYRFMLLEALTRKSEFPIGPIRRKDRIILWLFRRWKGTFRYSRLAAASAVLVLVIAAGVATNRRPAEEPPQPSAEPADETALRLPPDIERHRDQPSLEVWLVEAKGHTELYSNGLQVLNDYVTHTAARSFPVFSRGPGGEPETPSWQSRPAGIVFHTTVSEVSPPLARANNQLIRYRGKKLLEYLAREKLYNFVIDRFGRVYCLIPPTEYSNHAGHSVWSEGGEYFVNLNHSFIGVALETRPEAIEPDVAPEQAVTSAQLASARLLTEMLRERFGILEGNCVTHEMVSVNPDKMLIGYHTDWAGRFPFEQVGLPDNYNKTLPSVEYWGFDYDSQFVADVGGRVWPGVRLALSEFRQEALRRKLPLERFRRQRQRQYQSLLAKVRAMESAPPQAVLLRDQKDSSKGGT